MLLVLFGHVFCSAVIEMNVLTEYDFFLQIIFAEAIISFYTRHIRFFFTVVFSVHFYTNLVHSEETIALLHVLMKYSRGKCSL
jgi:hypothetical protein